MLKEDDNGAITTLTACILVVMLVGIGMFAFNEYERASLRQEAMTQTTSDIVVGDYRYSFSNLTKVQSVYGTIELQGCIDVFGDKIVWTQFTGSNYILRGYNMTSNSHFVIRSSISYNVPYAYADIGNGVVSWCEDINTESTQNYRVKVYSFSNGTTWTAPATWSFTPNVVYQPVSSVVVGKYVVYCNSRNESVGATKIDVMRFNTEDWTLKNIYNISISSSTNYAYLEQGGIEDEIIYSTSTVGYYRLNVETGATSPLSSPYNSAYHQHMTGISDNCAGIVDYTSYKFKAINFKTGQSTTLDNVTSGSGYEWHQPISNWGDNFYSYFICSPASPSDTPLLRFYDTETSTRFAIPFAGTTTIGLVNGLGMSDKYVAMMFNGASPSIYFYSYSRTDYTATANNSHDSNSNETAVPPETNIEKAQSWLQDNWIYLVVIGLVVGVAVFVGYKKFASSPKYREVGAKKNLNWGLIIAIGLITVLAIIFMV